MQTLNFQCGHCGGLMAVGTEHVGQQVRCPHCQQVVVAPAATPAPEPSPAPAPAAPPLELERHDDIFSQQGTFEDALFGQDAPKIDLPIEPGHQGTNVPSHPFEPPPQATQPTPTHAPSENGEATAAWQAASLAETHAAPEPQTQVQPPAEAPVPAVTVPRQARAGQGGGMFLPLVILPLFLYALAMTGLSIFLYLRLSTQQPSLFDQMPDVDGDNPGVKKGGKQASVTKPSWRNPLPEHLHTTLGKPLRVGDLEVTPLGVERRKVAVFSEGSEKPEPCSGDSLVLRLRLKNLAGDYSFTPIDNYFDRQWRGGSDPPLTILFAGDYKAFGGPAKWRASSRRGAPREWVEGRKDFDPAGLSPGESMETLTCTDGEDKETVAKLAAHKGDFVWRVHLRRGLIDHKGRKLPAQCVVGVRFSSKDIGG
ncbi:MAG: hypothetical protein K2W96_04070 [Gemmataceae bacterium]|nr:hypothetical protein [Gemmataceae bacterium]